jgi:hypothetical protein
MATKTGLAGLVRKAGAPLPTARTIGQAPSILHPEGLPVLLRSALRTAAAPRSRSKDPAVLWREGEDALQVYPARAQTRIGEGWLLVELPVRCEETGLTQVVVAFGLPRQVGAGSVVTVERPPRGPAVVVNRWGDALVALVWTSLHRVLETWARGGGDQDLVPAGVAVTAAGLSVLATRRPGSAR